VSFIDALKKLEACSDGLEWLEAQGYSSPQDAWDACHRGDWMFWVLEVAPYTADKPKREKLVQVCAECVALVDRIPRDLIKRASEAATAYAQLELAPEEVGMINYRIQEDARKYYEMLPASSNPDITKAAPFRGDSRTWTFVDALGYLTDMTRWPVEWVYGSRAISAVADGLCDKDSHLQTCAEIIRKHFPNPPEL